MGKKRSAPRQHSTGEKRNKSNDTKKLEVTWRLRLAPGEFPPKDCFCDDSQRNWAK